VKILLSSIGNSKQKSKEVKGEVKPGSSLPSTTGRDRKPGNRLDRCRGL